MDGRLFFGCDGGILTMVTFCEKVRTIHLHIRGVLTRQQEFHSEGFYASEKPIRFIAVNSCGNHLALGGGDEVTIWSMSKGRFHPLSVSK